MPSKCLFLLCFASGNEYPSKDNSSIYLQGGEVTSPPPGIYCRVITFKLWKTLTV